MIQRVAAYALIKRDERLLLCRLCPPEPNTGKWTVPGGGLDFGEHPEAAAVREVKEETGYDVRLGHLIDVQSEVFESSVGQMHALRFIYSAEIIGGELTHEVNGSTDLVAWHTHEEALAIPKVGLATRIVELAFETPA